MTQRSEQASETLIGAAVILVAAGFLAFAVTQAGSATAARAGYQLVAQFDRADGIGPGADVRVSGVKVGSVADVRLDPTTYQARVELALPREVQIPEDSVARIASDGLLGGAHVSIEVGGSETSLPNGGEFVSTQGAVDLLTLFASFARSQGSASEPSEEEEVVP